MDWREVAVTVSSAGEEAVADLFYQVGCPGVSVEDPELLQSYIESGVWDYHVFGEVNLTGTAVVTGYLPESPDLPEKLAALERGVQALLERFPAWVIQVKGTTVKEEDWATAWKAYFKPVRVGGRFLIKPAWEKAEPKPGEAVVEIDPGMAFGTGTHPTTTLCLEALAEVVYPGAEVFDLGTGSGILAIAAAKLGAKVWAVDLDPVAVRVAAANVALNGVTAQVSVLRGDLGAALTGEADLVVANIIADVILDLLPDLPRLLRAGGQFLASGIIEGRAAEVEAGLENAGMEIIRRREDSGWVLFQARWADVPSV
ncbi:ribosomal protein L11 methyltransferase [Peptococcaceae bacterium CEB3]|nr:ribosomal protein L11 methyltransferase [Peptococcaceae bacterium CEB3]